MLIPSLISHSHFLNELKCQQLQVRKYNAKYYILIHYNKTLGYYKLKVCRIITEGGAQTISKHPELLRCSYKDVDWSFIVCMHFISNSAAYRGTYWYLDPNRNKCCVLISLSGLGIVARYQIKCMYIVAIGSTVIRHYLLGFYVIQKTSGLSTINHKYFIVNIIFGQPGLFKIKCTKF